MLGRRISGSGLDVGLADTVPMTTVPEASLAALFRHELRWARTIRALEPAGFAASVLQYPLFWAFLTFAAGASLWSLGRCCLLSGSAGGVGCVRVLAPDGGDRCTEAELWAGRYPIGACFFCAGLAFAVARCPCPLPSCWPATRPKG